MAEIKRGELYHGTFQLQNLDSDQCVDPYIDFRIPSSSVQFSILQKPPINLPRTVTFGSECVFHPFTGESICDNNGNTLYSLSTLATSLSQDTPSFMTLVGVSFRVSTTYYSPIISISTSAGCRSPKTVLNITTRNYNTDAVLNITDTTPTEDYPSPQVGF
jgi:hypothetical protein